MAWHSKITTHLENAQCRANCRSRRIARSECGVKELRWEISIRSAKSSVQQDHDAFGKCATPGKLQTPAYRTLRVRRKRAANGISIRRAKGSVQQDREAFGKCAMPGKLPIPACRPLRVRRKKLRWEISIRSAKSSVQQDREAFGKCAMPGKLPIPA